ncbi:MAG: hypothetical protein IPO91_18800 [Chloroflexi bacterium]|nr:hypothetical protein [Chloroflexota bacterium]
MKRCLVIAAGNRFDDINLQQLTSIVREYEIDLVTEISFGNETTQKIDFLIWIYSDDGFQERDDLVSFIEALSIAEHLIPIVGTCAFIPPSVAMLNPIRFDVGIRSLEQVYPLPALHNLIRRILASDTENPRIAASQALFTTATGVSDDLWTSLRSGENQRRGAVTQIVERMYPVVRSSQNWMLAEIRHLISHSGQSLLVLISDANLRSQSAVADAYQDLKRGVMPRIEISSPIADVVGDIAVFSLAEQLSPTALFERLTLTLSKDAYILQQLAEFDTRLSTRQKFYKLAAILIENTKLILITDIEPFVQRDGILDSSLADNLLRAVATNGTRHAIVVANSQGNVEVFQGYDGRIPLLVPSAIRPSVLQPVPNHTTVPYMLPDLERQAAEYYATSRKTIKAFELPTDIDPFLNEIEHLVKAEDYDRACEEFIAATERISLARWGSYSQLRKVILRFLGHPLKDAFRGRMLGILGNYYEIAGMYKDGVEHLTEALETCRRSPRSR